MDLAGTNEQPHPGQMEIDAVAVLYPQEAQTGARIDLAIPFLIGLNSAGAADYFDA